MPALNFKKEFASAVEAGTKLQTIRQVWIHPIKVGDTVYLKTGMRTKKCRALNEGIVVSVEIIWIEIFKVFVSGTRLTPHRKKELIIADGFNPDRDPNQFYQFFQNQYGLPFEGVLIKWRLK